MRCYFLNHLQLQRKQSARIHNKMRLLNCVPCVLKTCWPPNMSCVLMCSCSNVPCVLTCSRTNLPCVLTCSRANVSCMLTFTRANVPREFKCSRGNMPWGLCLTWLVWPRNHLPTFLVSTVSSFDANFFSFTVIVIKLYTLLERFKI